MSCLKCGKENEEACAFCASCLEDMKAHPVKPGTAIQLPVHPDEPVERKKARRQHNPNEELHRLRSLNHWLAIVAVIMGLAAAALAAVVLFT